MKIAYFFILIALVFTNPTKDQEAADYTINVHGPKIGKLNSPKVNNRFTNTAEEHKAEMFKKKPKSNDDFKPIPDSNGMISYRNYENQKKAHLKRRNSRN